MYSKVNSVALKGLEGYLVDVESDVSAGIPDFAMVGFLSSEVKEARERVRTALRNSDFTLPPRKITVNLSPASIRKEGTSFDLAIAVSLLVGFGYVPVRGAESVVLMGELSLDGMVLPIQGVLPRVLTARKEGFRTCFVPWDNRLEGAVVEGMQVIGVRSLEETVHLLRRSDERIPEVCPSFDSLLEASREVREDFSEVHGQQAMKRAAEIAAAGMHNLLMIGTPGSGKSMIARRMPGILPCMTMEESLAVSQVYSVAGLLPPEMPLITERPFRSPHHTISTAALVGGGRIPHPGEISLADRGILFLDELPEFQKTTLEVLRQPMEDREVIISRVHGACRFPADTMIVAAMNPCACGYYPDRSRCHCREDDVRRYMQRISRPLLDRMDLCVEAPPVDYRDLQQSGQGEESSAKIRARVEQVHEIQKMRYRKERIYFNSQMQTRHLARYCPLGAEENSFMREVFETRGMSARGYHRVLKVARTIADLAGSDRIQVTHLMEAVGYRSQSEKFWG